MLNNVSAVGAGYLDNVSLVTARRGPGTPARWVEKCTCPPGYLGQHCEQCDLGYRRSQPELGRFSSCEPCNCNEHSDTCDPVTGLSSQLTYLYCIAIVLIFNLLICSQETGYWFHCLLSRCGHYGRPFALDACNMKAIEIIKDVI